MSLRDTCRHLELAGRRKLAARWQPAPIAERLLRGAFWSVAGTMLSRALSLAAAILVARTLGKVVYGELGIIQSTVGMFGTLAGFGMGTTSSKFVAEFRDKDPQRAGRIIALSSVVSWAISIGLGAVLALLAPALCLHTLAAPHLAPGLRDSAALLILSGINGAQLGVLAGLEAFKTIARVSVLTGLLSFPLIVGGALLFGLTGVIGGMAAAQTSGCLLNLRALRREARRYRIPLSYSSCVSELPILWRFSVPAVLAELLISSINWCAAAMLVRQPNGYSEMGSFSAANQWFNMLMWLPFMLNSVMLPVLSERLGANDKGNVAGLLKLTMKMNAAIVLPCVVVGSLLSPYIMMSYGRGFAAAWPTLVAVLVTAGLLSVELPVGQLIAASGRMWLGFSSNIGWSLVFLTATAVLLRLEWGSLGLAAGRLAAYGAHTVFSISYAVFFARSPRATETSTPALSLRAFR